MARLFQDARLVGLGFASARFRSPTQSPALPRSYLQKRYYTNGEPWTGNGRRSDIILMFQQDNNIRSCPRFTVCRREPLIEGAPNGHGTHQQCHPAVADTPRLVIDGHVGAC